MLLMLLITLTPICRYAADAYAMIRGYITLLMLLTFLRLPGLLMMMPLSPLR